MNEEVVAETPFGELRDADFTDDNAWIEVRDAADAEVYEVPDIPFHARLIFIDDRTYEGISPEKVPELAADDPGHRVVFVVDSLTLRHKDHRIQAIDTMTDLGANFRVVPPKVWSVENNINEVNSEFARFAEDAMATEDGISR